MIDAPEIKRKTTGTDLIRAIFWPTDYYHFPDLLLRMLVKFLYTIIRINNPLFVKRLNRDFIDLQNPITPFFVDITRFIAGSACDSILEVLKQSAEGCFLNQVHYQST